MIQHIVRSKARAARWAMTDSNNILEGTTIAIVGCGSWSFVLWATYMILTH